jgi:hypothetical protein
MPHPGRRCATGEEKEMLTECRVGHYQQARVPNDEYSRRLTGKDI